MILETGEYVFKTKLLNFNELIFLKLYVNFCKLLFLQAVFRLYDRDGSGYLSAFELRQALNSAGYRLNNHILNILVHRYGTKEGLISFDDYIMCAVRLKTMIGKDITEFDLLDYPYDPQSMQMVVHAFKLVI